MSGERGLLDISSAVTLAELSVGPHIATSDHECSGQQARVPQAEADFEVLEFDRAAQVLSAPSLLRPLTRRSTCLAHVLTCG